MGFPALALSHFELLVDDVVLMERFYCDRLGFVVTDRGSGPLALVFLSRNPGEHHQVVLNPGAVARPPDSPLDHLAFRVGSLADLRVFHHALVAAGSRPQAVCHGTSWSVYFRDPEGNRLEIFVDTPWYVHQPCRFAVDLGQSDADLFDFTRGVVAAMPGFRDAADWQRGHVAAIDAG